MNDTPNQNNQQVHSSADENSQIPSLVGAELSRLRDILNSYVNARPINVYQDFSQPLNKIVGLLGNQLGVADQAKNLQLPNYNTWNAGSDLSKLFKQYGFKPLNLYIEQSARIERLVGLWEGMTKEQRDAISGFTSSLQTLVGSTFSIKTAFQLSDKMSDIKQLANIEGESSQDIVWMRNIYRRKGMNDDDFLDLQKKLSGLTVSLKLDPEKLKKDEHYQFFAKYNAELNKTSDASGRRYSALDRQRQLEDAIKKAQASKIDPDLIKGHLDAILGEKIAVKVYAVITDPNAKAIEAEELVNAKRQEKGMPAAVQNRDVRMKTTNSHESVSGGVSIPFTQPVVGGVMGMMNAALNQYPDEIGKFQGGAAILSEGTKWLEFAYKAYKGFGAVKDALYPSSDSSDVAWHPRGPKRLWKNALPPIPPPDAAPVTENERTAAGDRIKFGIAAAGAALKSLKPAPDFTQTLQQTHTSLTRGGAVIKSNVNAKEHGYDYIPSGVKNAANKIEKKIEDPSVKTKILQDMETIFILILKKYVPALRNVPTNLLLPNHKLIIQNDLAKSKSDFASNSRDRNPAVMDKGGVKPRNLALDMQHAAQASKVSQEINNQQYHTVINVTPANADPMRVAEIVYNKFKHASFGQAKSAPSKEFIQTGSYRLA